VSHAGSNLLSDDFYQYPLLPSAIEFTVKDPFPGTEIEFSAGDRHHHFPAHDLAFHMGIGVLDPWHQMELLGAGPTHAQRRTVDSVDHPANRYVSWLVWRVSDCLEKTGAWFSESFFDKFIWFALYTQSA
jgi:hypothetical protein